ncbi:ATP-dependent DNA helicase [Fusobacterium varium]|uniref:ATP-dependent DNA helicase n=1 Tax=Fusobacterium varium TaxID=856 RepID=UPI000E424E72|nr:ATP-dependent DNA helicase [Fusobacterium varium]RGJ31654.1 ATP-dependent helicase [Fusobacterium varium]
MEHKEINLNKEQKEAATHIEGPLLVIAGPGSGKTRTLVERVVHMLIEKKISPEKIMVSTFTDRASKELIGRVSERIKDCDSKININDIYMGTLHSICLRLIDEYIEYSDFSEGYQVLDELEQHFFIFSKIKEFKEIEGYNEFFKEIPAANNWGKAGKIQKWVNRINEEGRSLDYVKEEQDKKIEFLKKAHELYQKLLIEDNVIDFASIQREIYKMLLNNDTVLEEIREKIQYIMIDEYQDTNSIQEKIIFELGGNRKNICVVGDDDQGIYRFRGASVKNILEFPNKFDENECRIITLDINYRSHKDIITFCNRWINLINWKNFRYQKDIQPPADKEFVDNPGVIRIGGNSENQWKENIYKFIKNLKAMGKIEDYSQVAFLFKSVRFSRVKELIDYLEERCIPTYSPRSKNFFYRKEVKLVLGALLVLFPQTKPLVLDDVYIRKTAAYYNDCIAVLKKYLAKDKELYEWILKNREKNIDLGEEKGENISRIFYSLFAFNTFKELIDLSKNGAKEGREIYNLGILSQIFDKFENISRIEYITKENIEKVVRYFFVTHIRLLFEKGIDEYENKETLLGAVSFMTIHQAKGLEFPVVIVGSLESEPDNRELTEEDRLEDIITLGNDFEPRDRKNIFDFWRVFYTAFSRAQNLLVLTSIENRAGGKELPSKIFKPVYETIPYWNDEIFHFEKLQISKLKETETKEFLSYTGHILIYEDCPLRYRFYKEFEFKPLKNNKTSFGILVHKTIESIHKEVKNNTEKIYSDEELKELVEKNYNILKKNVRVFLGENIRERAFEQIKRYVDSVKNNWNNLISSEEKEYSVEDNYILEGTIDLLRKQDDYIELLDFKTGRFSGYDDSRYDSYERQIEIYSYMLREKYNLENLRAYLYYTGNKNEPMVEIKLEKNKIEKTISDFEDTVKRILNKEFNRREYSEEKCRECEFKDYCRGE